ncbi:MAG: hybrid sensor histidine kinase/response regulator [Methanoregula sp.]|nr:hybrid sensor histidine kinase/response regulator [Methanoregula sp.]
MTGQTRFSGSRILVVEDSRTQAEYLCHLVATGGYKVILAGDGRDALEKVHKEHPDLVLTDIIMPEMDGYELCRAIKADNQTAGIPVILVTQLYDPADVLKGLEAGADNFIVKPFDPGQVYSRITDTLEAADIPDPDGPKTGIDIVFDRQSHRITSSRSRILNILLSTYEFAVRKNTELQEAHEHMSTLNEELTNAVEELQVANRNLSMENAQRSRVEKALADANRKLSLMTSITRHDINNQILALQGFIVLSESEITDPTILQYMRKAKAAAQTIQKQIAFTKSYEDIGAQAPRWQDIRKIAEPLRSCLKGVGIGLDIRDISIEIYADPLLSKVFGNLADNSIRHGRHVQHIIISAERHENGGVILRYQDDGDGVAEADKEKIFQKGFGKNTGLGLFLSREILEITGITIWEAGVPGKGALFEITVPPEGVRKAGK